MEFDDLKTEWRKEMETLAGVDTEILRSTQNRVADYDRKVKLRDIREIVVALFLVGFFAFAWSNGFISNALSKVGMLVLISACLFICFRLISARQYRSVSDWSLRARIEDEIAKLQRQGRLLRSVTYWYTTPIMIGVFLISLGEHYSDSGSYLPSPGLCLYWLLCVGLSVFIHRLNRRAALKNVTPLLTKLEGLKEELENTSKPKY